MPIVLNSGLRWSTSGMLFDGGKLDPRLGSLAGVKGLKAADENEASWDCIGTA